MSADSKSSTPVKANDVHGPPRGPTAAAKKKAAEAAAEQKIANDNVAVHKTHADLAEEVQQLKIKLTDARDELCEATVQGSCNKDLYDIKNAQNKRNFEAYTNEVATSNEYKKKYKASKQEVKDLTEKLDHTNQALLDACQAHAMQCKELKVPVMRIPTTPTGVVQAASAAQSSAAASASIWNAAAAAAAEIAERQLQRCAGLKMRES